MNDPTTKKTMGLVARDPKRTFSRRPRGTKEGGQFAGRSGIASETQVDLAEGELVSEWSPDGSAAFEERMRRREEERTKVTPPSDSAAAKSVPDDTYDLESASSGVSAIRMGGAVEYAEGSWSFPPAPTTDIETMATYWGSCLIPDGALVNVEAADRWGRDVAVAEKEFDDWSRTKPGITKRFRKKNPEEAEALSAEYVQRNADLDKVRYHMGLIPRSELRDVVRLGAFWEQASGLDDESRGIAASRKFITSTGEEVSALDTYRKYRLWEISGAFFNRVRYERFD